MHILGICPDFIGHKSSTQPYTLCRDGVCAWAGRGEGAGGRVVVVVGVVGWGRCSDLQFEFS